MQVCQTKDYQYGICCFLIKTAKSRERKKYEQMVVTIIRTTKGMTKHCNLFKTLKNHYFELIWKLFYILVLKITNCKLFPQDFQHSLFLIKS